VKERNMSQQSTGPSRLSRIAAKKVPHRSSDRLFAAKSSAKTMCEDLIHDVRRSAVHEAVRIDFLDAIDHVQHRLHDISPDVPHAASWVRDFAKEISHLQVAHTWVAAAERVLGRLGAHGPKGMRDALVESQDSVMWCVRAGHWDGQLTSAVTGLEACVKDAEVHAARVAS
jgi:hypothetical protein